MSDAYGDLAEFYDAIYAWKDYSGEADRLRILLNEAGVSDGSRVLEAAVGTGGHLVHLRRHFSVAGFDRSEPMLAQARAKLPEVPLWEADLADFTVAVPYDAVLCLFSSIGYLLDDGSLDASARCFARALRPGGIAVVEPWFTPEAWQVGRPHLVHYQGERLALARACVSDRDGELAVMDMFWLIAREGGQVEQRREYHALRLLSHARLVRAFEEAGFSARVEPVGLMAGRGLLVARR